MKLIESAKKFTNIEFISKAEKKHQDKDGVPLYNYSKTEYHGMNLPVMIICKKCNSEFIQRSSHHLRGSGCKNCFLIDKKKNQPKDINDFIKKSLKIHDDKYDYSNTEYKDFLSKVDIFCNKCQKYFSQSPKLHLKGHGCTCCGRNSRKEKITKSNIEFISLAQEKHKDINGVHLYDYSKTNYTGSKNNVIVICKKCGNEFIQRASHHLNGNGCKKCANIKMKIFQLSNTIDFIKKSKNIHGDKYDYSNVEYVDNKSKVNIWCKKCDNYFLQAPQSHLNDAGCPKCGIISQKIKMTYTNDDFINKAKIIHQSYKGVPLYDYSKIDYIGTNSYVTIICKKCGKEFIQRASHHLNGTGCSNCNKSKGEKYIENQLNLHNIEYKSQKRFDGCKNKITLPFDFYLLKYNLCIEYDGTHHYEIKKSHGGFERLVQQRKNDRLKTKYCNTNNITLYRIKYTDNLKDSIQDIFDYIKTQFKSEI